MKLNFTLSALLLPVLLSVTSCAQSKKASVAQGKAYAKLIEATVQRTIPGIRDAEIETVHKFVIVWLSKDKPQDFFWKSAEAWQNCTVSRVRQVAKRNNNNTWYRTEEIDFNTVKKGDTLELVPFRGGKFPIPAAIPPNMNNVILFKTTKTNWLYLAASNITKKPDIVLN